MRKFTLLNSLVLLTFMLLSMQTLQAQVLTEGFESGLPTSYTTTTSYTLSSGIWTGQANGVIRSTTGVESGSYSLQLRSQTGAQITSPTISGGISTITFWGSGSTTSTAVQVNYSTDGGTTWNIAIGSPFSLTTGTPVQKTATINSSATSILIQFYRTSGTVYIDDVNVYGPTNAAADPVFTPTEGSYTSVQSVTISNGSSTDHIHYTTDGSEPTSASTLYTGAISVSTTTTIKAIAYDSSDANPSSVVSATYTINLDPTITITESTVPEINAETGTSKSEIIHVSGTNLTGNINLSISGTNSDLFSVSPSSITPASGTVSDTEVTITYSPSSTGTHTATLTASSSGAMNVTRDLSGYSYTVTEPDVIITEVYGGGGNSGATYTNDYIELYNRTSSDVNITGWSLQYYSSTGTSPNTFVFPSNSVIPAATHYLIECASSGSVGSSLSHPDQSCGINLSGTSGKVILYNTNTLQNISDLASILDNSSFVDYLPYGTSAVPVWGSAMSSNLSSTTSATRSGGGSPSGVKGQQRVSAVTNDAYVYTGNIGSDFSAVTPTPKSSYTIPTGLDNTQIKDIYAANGTIRFSATAGEKIQIFNSVGQQVVNQIAINGINEIVVNAKGVMIVKVGTKTAKIIL